MEHNPKMHALSEMLAHPGWVDVLHPSVAIEMQQALNQLMDQRRDRSMASDDFLRGKIAAFRWFLTSPAKTVNDYMLSLNNTEPDAPGQPEGVGHPYAEDNPQEG